VNHLLSTILFTPMGHGAWGLPVVFTGMPGSAKTRKLAQLAASWGLPFEGLAVGARGEGAFGVVPVPDGAGRVTYPRPDWTDRFVSQGRGLILVDELTTAGELLQHALMALLSERVIGSHQLPGGVRVIGACNPPDVVRGFTLAAPVANRIGHLMWEAPSLDEWSEHMMSQVSVVSLTSKDPAAEESRVLLQWPSYFGRSVASATAFLRTDPEMRERPFPVDDPRGSGPWPSLRTWDYAMRADASSRLHGLEAVGREALVESFIGNQAAASWFTWAEQADLPDPADVLDGKVKYQVEPHRLDRAYAVLQGCTAMLAAPATESAAEKAARLTRSACVWSILSAVGVTAADIVVPFAARLVKAGLHKCPEAQPVLKVINPAVTAGVK